MPKYHFSVWQGLERHDVECAEYPDLQAAYEEAIRGIRSIIADQSLHGDASAEGFVNITDQNGSVRQFVSFQEAIKTGTSF